MTIGKRTTRTGLTTGKTLHRARLYDAHAAFLTLGRGQTRRETTIALARIKPGDAVLDVGCGTGELTMLASTRTGPDGQTAGIDASPEMIAEARRKAARAGVTVDYRVAAVEALPYPNESFDVVLSSLLMHHLPDDLKDRALAEIRRVLKPDGRLLVLDFRQPTTLRERLALPFLLHPQWRTMPDGLQEWPARLTAAGFVAVEAGETDYSPVGYVRARVGPA
jgi:demethylmenaquinone methyltransferase/2-methoxy-6-polyprenyl-1,4-benzoquinol methylase/phosphoethanolamine N-methyltransferase